MRKAIYFLLVLVIYSSISCDKKTKSKEIQKETKTKVSKSLSLKEKSKLENDSLKTKMGSIIEGQAQLKPFLYEYGKKNPETHVLLKTSMGNIELELYKDTPLHRANFILLVKQDYFNHTMIHRVSPKFVIQGGNSDGYETPKKRQRIGNYLLPNESKPKYTHVRGALSAAKYLEQNISDASSPFEFFIVQPERGAHHLDGKHTVFGRVTKGMDVVDKINKVAVDRNEWPIENIYIDMEIID